MRENQIYTTSNYDSFVFRGDNRDIDLNHVKKIAESMTEKGWQGVPIEISVNEKGEYQIEDGQHRYMAAKDTKTPINFIMVKSKTVYEIATQNSMKKGWNNSDFISAYAGSGNYNYKRLEGLQREFKNTALSDILDVVSESGYGKRKEELKKGYLRITDEQFYKARTVLKDLNVISAIIKEIGIKTQATYKRVVIALLKNNLINGERMADKLAKYGRMVMPESASRGQALDYLERVYNYAQKKDIVYFHDAIKKAK